MIYQGNTPVDTIWLHCAATRPEWWADRPIEAVRDEIDRWHRDRGWKGIGYHWIIDRAGNRIAGRPETQQGAHVAGHNRGSIGICLMGGHGSTENDRFEDHFTPAQEAALWQLIGEIRGRTQIKAIRGHNEVAAKACPGFVVRDWVRGREAGPLEGSKTIQGGAVTGVGVAGAAAAEMAAEMQDVARVIEPMAAAAPILKWVFLALVVGGLVMSMRARMGDWRAGQR